MGGRGLGRKCGLDLAAPSLGADPYAPPPLPGSAPSVIDGTGTCDEAAAGGPAVPSLQTSSCDVDVVQNRLCELW